MHILIMHAMCIITVIIIASLASIVPTLHAELKSWEEPGDEAIEVQLYILSKSIVLL